MRELIAPGPLRAYELMGPWRASTTSCGVITQRRAYGFHSHGALISMLFLCYGGIELAPPQPTPV